MDIFIPGKLPRSINSRSIYSSLSLPVALPVLSASPVSVFFALSHGNTSRIKVEDAIRSTLDEGHKFFRENPQRTVVPAISCVCHGDLALRVLFGVYAP